MRHPKKHERKSDDDDGASESVMSSSLPPPPPPSTPPPPPPKYRLDVENANGVSSVDGSLESETQTREFWKWKSMEWTKNFYSSSSLDTQKINDVSDHVINNHQESLTDDSSMWSVIKQIRSLRHGFKTQNVAEDESTNREINCLPKHDSDDNDSLDDLYFCSSQNESENKKVDMDESSERKIVSLQQDGSVINDSTNDSNCRSSQNQSEDKGIDMDESSEREIISLPQDDSDAKDRINDLSRSTSKS